MKLSQVSPLNGDGLVTAQDYTKVITHGGTGTPPAEPPSSVPEPATMGLLIMGGLLLLRRKPPIA